MSYGAKVALIEAKERISHLESALKASSRALSAAREMLGVFEDNGGHDGLGGKGYLATLDQIDDAQATNRVLFEQREADRG